MKNKKTTAVVPAPRAILPPNKVMKSRKDYDRKSVKQSLRKEVSRGY